MFHQKILKMSDFELQNLNNLDFDLRKRKDIDKELEKIIDYTCNSNIEEIGEMKLIFDYEDLLEEFKLKNGYRIKQE